MSYGCGNCGGMGFEVQMRMVKASLGPMGELQVAGIVPTRVCLTPKCRQVTVVSDLKILDPVPLIPAPTKQLSLSEMDQAKMEELRKVVQSDAEKLAGNEQGAPSVPPEQPGDVMKRHIGKMKQPDEKAD